MNFICYLAGVGADVPSGRWMSRLVRGGDAGAGGWRRRFPAGGTAGAGARCRRELWSGRFCGCVSVHRLSAALLYGNAAFNRFAGAWKLRFFQLRFVKTADCEFDCNPVRLDCSTRFDTLILWLKEAPGPMPGSAGSPGTSRFSAVPPSRTQPWVLTFAGAALGASSRVRSGTLGCRPDAPAGFSACWQPKTARHEAQLARGERPHLPRPLSRGWMGTCGLSCTGPCWSSVTTR